MEYVETEVSLMDSEEAKDIIPEYHVCSAYYFFTGLMNKFRAVVKWSILHTEEHNMDLDDIDFNQLEQSSKE